MNNNTSEGYLKISVTEAGGTIPIENALVVISEYTGETEAENAGEVLYSLRTNEGGLTPTVPLPAPPAVESMRPGAAQPYSVYNVTVTYDGYYPIEGVGVPVFSGITAIQPFNMIPLSEAGKNSGVDFGRYIIFETPDTQSLQPGGLQREDIGNKNGTVSGGIMQGGQE